MAVIAKNKGGRPPAYKTAEEMQVVVDDYFIQCEGEYLKDDDGRHILNKNGHPVKVNTKRPTVTGLALHLGLATRSALLNYQGKKEFMYTITRAKSRCEEWTEGMLYTRDGARGAEFSLRCNFKWDDRPPEPVLDSDIGVDMTRLINAIRNPVDGHKMDGDN